MNSLIKIKMKIDRKSIGYIVLATFFLQAILILYNNFTGFIHIKSFGEFSIRLFMGTLFGSIAAIYLFWFDVQMLNYLNDRFDWKEKFFLRLPIEICGGIVIAASGGILITSIVHLISAYKESFLWILFTNSIIAIIINIVLIVILEAIHFYIRVQESRLVAEQLQKENAEIKLDTLKSHLNPHFLFNSLNVLSSLIKKNPEVAQTFVDEFAVVYRYTLDVIDKTVVTLKEEMEFAKAYLYLQKIRFGNAVKSEINIDVAKLDYMVPPLSIQTLLENAFKHNKATVENPLNITISDSDDSLVIKNNYQPKIKSSYSKGVGLENLAKRYKLICGEQPLFMLNENEYQAIIPLVKSE